MAEIRYGLGADAQDQIIGALLGTAIGDAIGLPYEGISRRRGIRMLGSPDRHRFLFGYGMVSDDTEQTCFVAQSLIKSGGDPDRFQQSLARYLRLWLLGIPAGIGFATLRSILRLWLGYSPQRSGVYSAGNGPAMRAAILGVSIAAPQELQQFVRASTRLTHTDPKAEMGAFAVAVAAQITAQGMAETPDEFLVRLTSYLRNAYQTEAEELIELVSSVVGSVKRGESTETFAVGLGLSRGVTGYVYHTVPVALHAVLSFPRDYRSAIRGVIQCGGDTDTTAAITGGIVGAAVGRSGIPQDWLCTLIEWPRSISWMERLGAQLASSDKLAAGKPIGLPAWGIVARNILFITTVLFHGFRRLGPPY